MARPTIESSITEGLGYCCIWFFFKHFRSTPLIAARLGFDPRNVRRVKAEAKKAACQGCPNCMHAKVTLEGSPRKVRSSDAAPQTPRSGS